MIFWDRKRSKNGSRSFLRPPKRRNESLGHCLFSGPPGLGKTTLAHIIAKTMGTNLVVTSGPAIEKAGDLAGLLTNLKTGDVLFIDEIHRLAKTAEEYLYPAMEDFALDLMIDSAARMRAACRSNSILLLSSARQPAPGCSALRCDRDSTSISGSNITITQTFKRSSFARPSSCMLTISTTLRLD